jgi:CheY-like chemotaxis protein
MLSQLPDRRSANDLTAGTPSVLVIDDEAAVRIAMCRFLSRRGWSVCEASDGESARALLDPAVGRTFDLIICDLNMPRLSGRELYAWLELNRPDAASRIAFSSGDVAQPETAEFLLAARRPVLPKPFELGELTRIVDKIYSQAQAA